MKTTRPSTLPRILASTIAALLIATHAHAVTETWDGGGADNNFSTGLNWLDNSAPLSDLLNTDLIFAGVVRLTPNVSAALSTNSIVFNNTAGAFTLGGSGLTVGTGGITNNDADTQTFTNAISLGTASSSFNAASGALVFNGALGLGTSTLTVPGAANTTLGVVNGTGTINKSGTGSLNIIGTATAIGADFNLDLGTTNLMTGTTQVLSSTSTVAVNATSILNLNESLTLNGAQLTRAAGATLTLAAGKTLTVQSGGDAIITGGFTQATAATVTVTGAGSTLTTTTGSEFRGGSTLNVLAGGSFSSASYLDLARSGAGSATLLVDGTGSSFTVSSVSDWGQNGGTALATFSNGATGTIGNLTLANVGALSTATLNVQSGAALTLGNLFIATSTASATGTLNVTGAASQVTQTGSATLTIGAATGSSGGLTVQSGGVFSTGTGAIVENALGTIDIGAGGTFNANGNMTVNRMLTRNATGVFNLAAGKSLTLQNGGDAIFAGSYNLTTAATINVTGAGSNFLLSSASSLQGGSTVNVTAGGVFSNTAGLDLAAVGGGGTATVIVDGVGSRLDLGYNSNWAVYDNAAVTFRNGSVGNVLADVRLASDSSVATGTVRVESGSSVSVGSLELGAGFNDNSGTASLTVDGALSQIVQTGSLTLGDFTFGGSGTLTVSNGGTFTSGTGSIRVYDDSAINVTTGGVFRANGDVILRNTNTRSVIFGAGMNRVAGAARRAA